MIDEAKGGLRRHLPGKGFGEDACIAAGVLKQGEDDKVRDYFGGGRIIFPNLSHARAIHLSGRSAHHSEPRYLHLPGQRGLFNPDALSAETLVVVEGVTNCIAVTQGGHACVALLRTSLKDEDIPKLGRCTGILLALDADDAGRRAALEIADLFGIKAHIITLPPGKDPCRYLRNHSAAEFQVLLDQAQHLISHHVGAIPTNITRLELTEQLNPVLKLLAEQSEPKVDAFFKEVIGPRFALQAGEITAYKRFAQRLRDGTKEAKSQKFVPPADRQENSRRGARNFSPRAVLSLRTRCLSLVVSGRDRPAVHQYPWARDPPRETRPWKARSLRPPFVTEAR